MKLFKKLKKGFTLVELVVVIAVIAILAAVSVVSYIGVTNKAKAAADSEIITQLNTQMRSKSIMEGPNKTAYEAYLDAKEIGFNLELMKPSSKGEFVWDQENDLFACVEVEEDSLGKVIAEDKSKSFANNASKSWVYTSSINESAKYCQYLNSKDKNENAINAPATINIKSGFDAGENMTVKAINYESNAGHSVVIRTNGGELTVNAPADTVYHYDYADMVTIEAVNTASYHENGIVPTIDMKGDGHVALESTSEVQVIHFTKTGTKDAKDADTFADLSVTIEDGAKTPVFTRDTVTINKDDGTKVAQVEVGGDKNYIWLFQEGIYEQTKVSTVNDKNETVWTNTSDVNDATKTVADQIANNYNGNRNAVTGKIEDKSVVVSEETYTIKFDEETRKFDVINSSNEKVNDTTIQETAKESILVDTGKTVEASAQIVKFAAGSGTKADPFIITNAAQMRNINNYYDNGCGYDSDGKWFENVDVLNECKYFKVKEGITHIDMTGWTPVNLCGSFDGNGVIFDNLDNRLFGEVYNSYGFTSEIRNFSINANIVKDGWISILIGNAASKMIVSDVTIHGYVEGGNASVFVNFGFYNNYSIYNEAAKSTLYPYGIPSYDITFNNCHSDATVVGTQNASVFFNHANGGNIYSEEVESGKTKKCKITINNSDYTGTMISAGAFSYVSTNWCDSNQCTLTFDKIDTSIFTASTSASNTKYVKENRTIALSGKATTNGQGKTIVVEKKENAVKCVATLWLAPNPGSMHAAYYSEECIIKNEQFETQNIKDFTITINLDTPTGICGESGEIYNLNRNGDGTLHGASIKFVQYDKDGNILGVCTYSIPTSQYSYK